MQKKRPLFIKKPRIITKQLKKNYIITIDKSHSALSLFTIIFANIHTNEQMQSV